MTQLSTHFSLDEMTATRSGLPNVASPAIIARLEHTADGMERVKTALRDMPVIVHSGFRCLTVNSAVGGSKTSDHMLGDACDFVCPEFGTPLQVAEAILAAGIKFDQLILEYGWVHISFGGRIRQQTLTKRSSEAPYEHGINA
jgi:zinc D-Ala-D-Ala carboxypeptidase